MLVLLLLLLLLASLFNSHFKFLCFWDKFLLPFIPAPFQTAYITESCGLILLQRVHQNLVQAYHQQLLDPYNAAP